MIDDWQGLGLGSELLQRLIARGREEGVAYLQKPFTQATLARKVREVLDEAFRPQAG